MIYLQDTDFELHQGDALEVLRTLPDESVHCCVTSPPFFGLRDYQTGRWEGGDAECDHRKFETRAPHERKSSTLDGGTDTVRIQEEASAAYRDTCGKCGATRIDQQIGLEETPEQWVQKLVEVFREVRRVLRRDGTLWLEIGDSYNSGTGATRKPTAANHGAWQQAGSMGDQRLDVPGVKVKDLIGAPWLLAFALRADGWYLRSDIVWSRPNPMPESVTDRPTKSHSYVFLLSKSARYFFDQEAVRESAITPWHGVGGYREGNIDNNHRPDEYRNDERERAGRNIRSVWNIATQPYPEAHFATYRITCRAFDDRREAAVSERVTAFVRVSLGFVCGYSLASLLQWAGWL